jgi:hypothetical protein
MHFSHRIAALFLSFLLLCPIEVRGSTLKIEFEKNALSVTTKDADMKAVLLRLSKEAGIAVWFPKTLDKKLTIQFSDIRLEKALKAILKGLSYATIYSRSGKNAKARISEVHVFTRSKKRTAIRPATGKSSRIERRISRYEKSVELAKEKLDRAASGSALEKRYQRQIRSYQRTIDRLKRRIR